MEGLICKRCGASLEWDGRSDIAKCSYCGTIYSIHPRNSRQGVKTGRDQVDAIQTSAGRYAGYPLVESYIPQGWTVETNAPEMGSNVLSPLTMQAAYTSPARDAFVTFTGQRIFNHLDQTPQNAQRQGQISHPDLMMWMSYMDSGAVCDSCIAGNPNLLHPNMLSETHDDQWAVSRLRSIVDTFVKNGGILNPGGNWTRRVYEVQDRSGKKWIKVIEALVTYVYLPVTQEEQMMYQLEQQVRARTMGTMMQASRFAGGLAGMAGLARNLADPVKPPEPKLRWSNDFVVETSAAPERIKEVFTIHERIRNTFKMLPLMERESEKIRQQLLLQAQQEAGVINDAMAQMNRDRMASWDRRQNIIRETSEYGSQVMREMYQSNSATQDRVNTLRSEAIRGVNSYYTRGGDYDRVEVDISQDHVYQNVKHPDYYASSQGAPFDFGVDYEELDRTNG